MYDPREVPPDQPIILLAREIAAPAELIFKAFGDAATIGTWWGPDGFTTTMERLDFRVVGRGRFASQSIGPHPPRPKAIRTTPAEGCPFGRGLGL